MFNKYNGVFMFKPLHICIYNSIGKQLFGVLREMVIERRGVADDSFYMCNRIGRRFIARFCLILISCFVYFILVPSSIFFSRTDREKCQAKVAAEFGFSISVKAQLASNEDSREAQRQRDLFERLKEPVPSLPLAPHKLPSYLETNLRRLRLMPDHDNADFNEQVFLYEQVVEQGDIVVVGDIENRLKSLINHREGKDGEVVHGIRYISLSHIFFPLTNLDCFICSLSHH